MTVLSESRHPVAFILSEAAGYRSREAIKIPESQTIQTGLVRHADELTGGPQAVCEKSEPEVSQGLRQQATGLCFAAA